MLKKNDFIFFINHHMFFILWIFHIILIIYNKSLGNKEKSFFFYQKNDFNIIKYIKCIFINMFAELVQNAIENNLIEDLERFSIIKKNFKYIVWLNKKKKLDKYVFKKIASFIPYFFEKTKPICIKVDINYLSPKYLNLLFDLCKIKQENFMIQYNDGQMTSLFLHAIQHARLDLIEILLKRGFSIYEIEKVRVKYFPIRNSFDGNNEIEHWSVAIAIYKAKDYYGWDYPNIIRSGKFIMDWLDKKK